jgi:hypothetical protein
MNAKKKTYHVRKELNVHNTPMNIMTYIRFWSTPSGAYDKGGTFNLQLYLDYLEIIHTR